MQFTPPDARRTKIIVGALTGLEELGRWAGVRQMLEHNPYLRHIELHGSQDNRAMITAVRERLAVALAYEEVHGRGSLIDRTNPENEKLDRIAAAYLERQRAKAPAA